MAEPNADADVSLQDLTPGLRVILTRGSLRGTGFPPEMGKPPAAASGGSIPMAEAWRLILKVTTRRP